MNEKKKPISYDELYEKIKKIIHKEEELDVINRAYTFAAKKHGDRKRLNGDDYITHPLEVANILTDLNVDYVTIASALLHETINHSETTINEIEEEFGLEIAKIVQAISKINKLALSDGINSAAYLREILVGLSEDVRVLFIKLADRLHNMRTLYALKEEDQKQKIKDTNEVLIPIAHRLGINSIKGELEDLCLKYAKPREYNDILEKLDASLEELNILLNEMKENISDILTENGVSFKIKARVKSVHSIYNKLETGRSWDDIYDILAMRIFVDTEEDCYLTIGIIHSRFKPVPSRFKDYIAKPKENMYQSLHTTVIGLDGRPFEIQVRTYEMDEIAEKGIASHWSYKEKGSVKIQNIMEQKLEMFRNIIEQNNSAKSDLDFASALNNELLTELIYCYTPKGDVVELPKGATPVDFAYRIHSGVGDRTIGAIVNDQIVPLDYALEDGDIVKINTSKEPNPKKKWLKIVKTSQARTKIKSYFSKKEKQTQIELGKKMLEKEIRNKKLSYSEVLTDENINKILKELHFTNTEDIYLSIGSLRYTPSYILNIIYEDKRNIMDIYLDKMERTSNKTKSLKGEILVAGVDNISVTIAKCCLPIKGDKIIGYITKGEGIQIHKHDCPNIKDSKRLIPVEWNTGDKVTYKTNLKIEILPEKDISSTLFSKASLKNIYLENLKINKKKDYSEMTITINTTSLDKLEDYISEIKSIPSVLSIERLNK